MSDISGKEIRKIRKELGLPQDELALLLEFKNTSSVISRIESGFTPLGRARTKLLRIFHIIHKQRNRLPSEIVALLSVPRTRMSLERFVQIRNKLELSQMELGTILRFGGAQVITDIESGNRAITKRIAEAMWKLLEKFDRYAMPKDLGDPVTETEFKKILSIFNITFRDLSLLTGGVSGGLGSAIVRGKINRARCKLLRIFLILHKHRNDLTSDLELMLPYRRISPVELRRIRKLYDMNQAEFAQAVGACSGTVISAMERRHVRVTKKISIAAERMLEQKTATR
uniref:Putative DNA binding, helix-turn-helix domain containing protein n=1 Tax=viral metagenome TaxID=1070528 RepID=A0A6M3IPJ5_9ZZZZ